MLDTILKDLTDLADRVDYQIHPTWDSAWLTWGLREAYNRLDGSKKLMALDDGFINWLELDGIPFLTPGGPAMKVSQAALFDQAVEDTMILPTLLEALFRRYDFEHPGLTELLKENTADTIRIRQILETNPV